jgi:hypothetical protein
MVFDKTLPIEGALAPTYNNIMRADKEALEAALNAWFYFVTGGTQTGQPRQGSARIYYQATAPATRLDGDYFDSTDYGTPWIDSDNSKLYFLTSADGAGTDTWTLASTEIIALIVSQINTWALAQTFSVNPVFTKGVVGNNAYIQARNAADNGNVDLIKADGSDSPTLPDASVLATSAAPTTDPMIANKLYVDNRRAYIKLVDSKASGTNGGTFTSGAWQKRTVAEETDTGSNCAVASSVIVLGAGTYECRISCPAYAVDNHQARLRNTTAGSTVLVGTSQRTKAADGVTNRSVIVGRFTIAASQNLEIQHYCQTTLADQGFGVPNGFGEVEIYTIAELWKI